MRHQLLLLYFLALTTPLFGQTAPQPTPRPTFDANQVIPPSPTAASLGRYGEVGVGYYTGQPDINIPLYEAKGRSITLPIRLQYTASGTRVADEASWVGLGWSLAAGGAITRTVRGLDDFKNNGGMAMGYYYAPPLPTARPVFLPVKSPEWVAFQNYFYKVAKGEYDSDPDIYSYNFGSYSGKFIMSKKDDGNVILQDERNNLKIEYLGSTSGIWLITDPKGYKFSFNTAEVSTNYTYSSNGGEAANDSKLNQLYLEPSNASITSAWYLTKITAPTGELMSFEYTRGESVSHLSKTEEQYNTDVIVACDGQDFHGSYPLAATYKRFTASKQVISDIYLKRILFEQGSIEFTTTVRDDVEFRYENNKPQKLSEIIIKNIDNNIIKRYELFWKPRR
jgi:hypothetical protein